MRYSLCRWELEEAIIDWVAKTQKSDPKIFKKTLEKWNDSIGEEFSIGIDKSYSLDDQIKYVENKKHVEILDNSEVYFYLGA